MEGVVPNVLRPLVVKPVECKPCSAMPAPGVGARRSPVICRCPRSCCRCCPAGRSTTRSVPSCGHRSGPATFFFLVAAKLRLDLAAGLAVACRSWLSFSAMEICRPCTQLSFKPLTAARGGAPGGPRHPGQAGVGSALACRGQIAVAQLAEGQLLFACPRFFQVAVQVCQLPLGHGAVGRA